MADDLPTPNRTRRRDGMAVVFIVAFLLPNLATLVLPYENFPYSSAPMFAHYVTHETPRYRFRFVAEPEGGGSEWELEAREIGLRNVEFQRYFFGSVYGSIDPRSPYGHHRHETRESFEARMADFFQRFAAAHQRAAPGNEVTFAGIRLELARLDKRNSDGEIRTVGRYDVGSGRFFHTWVNDQ